MKSLRIILISLLLSCFMPASSIALGQQKQTNPTPTRLALEITYSAGRPPAYDAVPNHSWYGGFRAIEGWTPAAEGLPVQAVEVDSRLDGDAVRVIVTAHVGRKFFEREDPVAIYLMRENEKVMVTELRAMGVEPFEIAIIRVAPKSAIVPAVTSNAPSLKVVKVEPMDETFPMCKITLQNASSKNIKALYVETYVDGTRRTSAMPHNREGEMLIAAGATYELKRPLYKVASPTAGGYTPETPPNQTLFIKTAVFEDGTYEGDPSPAAECRGFTLGEQMQLTMLVHLYQRALELKDTEAGIVIDSLYDEVSVLRTQIDQSILDKSLKNFPEFTSKDKETVKGAAELEMFELKKDALKAIDDFRQKRDSTIDKEATRVWLTASLDRFQKWLDHLQQP